MNKHGSTTENQVTTNQEQTEATSNTADDQNTTNNETSTALAQENFKQGDVFLTGDNVTIDYIIDGNLFVFANNVTINSQIGGDAFIISNSLNVTEQGYIFSNLFTISKDVNIDGVIYDLYALSQNVTISGYIYRDMKVSTDTLNVFGTIGRNAFVKVSNMNFTTDESTNGEEETVTSKTGLINGNLEYSSENEISIPDGAVTGSTNHKKIDNTIPMQSYIYSLGVILITAVLVWLICLWLAPKFVKNPKLINKKNILPTIGLGILTPIALVVVSVILLLIGITSSFALLIISLLFMLIAISTSIFIIAINNLICSKLKINKTIGNFGMLIITTVVLWLLSLIPYVGSIIAIIVLILGIGIIAYHLVIKEKNNTDNNEKTKTENK